MANIIFNRCIHPAQIVSGRQYSYQEETALNHYLHFVMQKYNLINLQNSVLINSLILSLFVINEAPRSVDQLENWRSFTVWPENWKEFTVESRHSVDKIKHAFIAVLSTNMDCKFYTGTDMQRGAILQYFNNISPGLSLRKCAFFFTFACVLHAQIS